MLNLSAYEPAALKGKYQFGVVDTWYTVSDTNYANGATGSFIFWIPWLYSNAYKKSSQATRESWCPSAMVDTNGDLYTLTFYEFKTKDNGPTFRLRKYVGSNTSLTVAQERNYSWDYGKQVKSEKYNTVFFPKYPSPKDYNTADLLLFHMWKENKNLMQNSTHGKNALHNMFSSAIAQEVTNNNEIYIVLHRIPETWVYSYQEYDDDPRDWEYLLYTMDEVPAPAYSSLSIFKINKNNFSSFSKFATSYEIWGCANNFLHICYQPLRTSSWNYKLQPEWGNLKALKDAKGLHLFKLQGTVEVNFGTVPQKTCLRYLYYKNDALSTPNGGTVTTGFNSTTIDGAMIEPRFQTVGNDTYFECTYNGNTQGIGVCSNCTTSRKVSGDYCVKIENTTAGSDAARYPSDFCILPNGNNPILCTLGFKYGMGWKNAFPSPWEDSHLVCTLCSTPLSKINWQTCPSNVIYLTNVKGGTGDAVNSSNTSAADIKRLYLNTQKIVPYTTGGRNYMIYAYCYPGNKKQLYLGFAPYAIGSSGQVFLYTMREFRGKNGDSFGNFTDCSRIITMDLKNNHLWITFMNGDSTAYYCFHILASDLVVE